jgi:hypothetical protein
MLDQLSLNPLNRAFQSYTNSTFTTHNNIPQQSIQAYIRMKQKLDPKQIPPFLSL